MNKRFDIMVLSGGFDPVHKGHVRMFKAAKDMAEMVIVGLNSDEWLVRKKGKLFMEWPERYEILDAFQYIDRVVPFDDKGGDARELLRVIRAIFPDSTIAFGNGGDRTSDKVSEIDMCRELRITPLFEIGGEKVQSSSALTGIKITKIINETQSHK